MALIDLKSDLSKFRSDFQTPTLENKVNASKYNIDDVPKKHGSDVNQTNYKGITGTNFNYPNLLINGKRLMQPAGTKNSQPVITFPGPQNFLNDKDASGFTLNTFKTGQSKKDTQFKSYFNYTDFKKAYIIPDTKSTGPTGWQPGNSTLISQLGTGIPNLIKSYDSLIPKTYNWYTPGGSKNAYHSGFHNGNKYSVAANINSITERGFLAATYNTNSPIDDVYKKYSLRDDAYNPTYMRHPLIVRGIQRKGNEKPQYWGFGSKSGFDDGLIRGGAVTVADRIIADTVRIAKWMASPKGLLWIVKQIGLGLTNPKVEAVGGVFGRVTRIHLGVTSLLSVPGTALGLHFTRHGIPFLNEVASYENVSKAKNNLLTYSIADITGVTQLGNRLIGLRKQLGLHTQSGATLIQQGMPILSLSGLAGPQSVYGIGVTSIRRSTQTISNRLGDILERNKINPFSINTGYSLNSGYKSAVIFPTDSYKQFAPTNSDIHEKSLLQGKGAELEKVNYTPGAKLNSTTVDLSTAKTRTNVYKSAPVTNINSYVTLAYGKIPKNKGENSFRDFRSDINNSLDSRTLAEASILGTGTNENYYKDNNLVTKYGFGTPGAVGADRTNPYDYILPGDKYTGDKKERTKLISVANFRGDKVNAYDIGDAEKKDVYVKGAEDFIKFYFEDGDIGKDVMVFRCTMNGFSDSFSPGWNRVDIMGRPDGAYLYTSFERSVSFNFTVAALSRAEMVPMWRKLNYLASYTMPDFSSSGTKPGGPFMRITIGNLFQQTPGFIDSLTYTIPDETTWDIAEDAGTNPNAKQLPLAMEVQMTFKIIGDYRPQLKGRVYSLSPFGASQTAGNWLTDAEPSAKSKAKKDKIAKTEADKPKTK